jgi:hypothetical protein
MRCSSLASISLFALLLNACATNSGGNGQATLPPMRGNPVVLTNGNLPPQGANFLDSNNRWQVHGVLNGATWRYGETDPHHIFVANGPGASFTDLGARNSWSVSCMQIAPSIRCTIEAPPAKGAKTGKLAVVDNIVCSMAGGGPTAGNTIDVGDGRKCFPLTNSGQAYKDLMYGRRVDGVSGYGFSQAASLRDWMVRIWSTSRQK